MAIFAVSTLFISALIAACASSSPIHPEAQPLVDAVEEAEIPDRWEFSYVPTVPSAFMACLSGVDEIDGVLDLDARAIWLQPRRDAPPIIVTETEVLVSAGATGTWSATAWHPSLDTEALSSVFGETLGGLVATGFRAPDLNTTVRAAVSIADRVERTTTPPGAVGDSLEIVMNAQRFADELASDGSVDASDPAPAPRLLATINDTGLVTSMVVAVGESTIAGANYSYVASYTGVAPLVLPSDADRTDRALADVRYPTPEESCIFQ